MIKMQPLLVTTAVIYEKDKLLLVKRAREPFKGYWSFIGGCGAFAYHSNPKDAVKREVKCDLSCDFEPKFLTYNYEDFYGKPSVVLYFTGRISGTPTINQKYVSEYQWFSVEEVQQLELGYDHQRILLKYVVPFLDEKNKVSGKNWKNPIVQIK